jgi:hypothetical protein
MKAQRMISPIRNVFAKKLEPVGSKVAKSVGAGGCLTNFFCNVKFRYLMQNRQNLQN